MRRSRGAAPGPILHVSRQVAFDNSSDNNKVCDPIDCGAWVVAVMTSSFRLQTQAKELTAAIHSPIHDAPGIGCRKCIGTARWAAADAEVRGSSRFAERLRSCTALIRGAERTPPNVIGGLVYVSPQRHAAHSRLFAYAQRRVGRYARSSVCGAHQGTRAGGGDMTITETTTIADIASALPTSVRVFQQHGIDFCCGGKQPIGAVCREQGLNFAEIASAIEASRNTVDSDTYDWLQEPLGNLTSHIVTTYHQPLREEMPRL